MLINLVFVLLVGLALSDLMMLDAAKMQAWRDYADKPTGPLRWDRIMAFVDLACFAYLWTRVH